jgi:hypothetical protein
MPNVFCPQCGKELAIPAEFAGKKLKCACGRSFVAPQRFPDGLAPDHAQPPFVRRRTSSSTSIVSVICLLVGICGGLALASGLLGIVGALSMDATVEVSRQDGGYTQTERIYNQGSPASCCLASVRWARWGFAR